MLFRICTVLPLYLNISSHWKCSFCLEYTFIYHGVTQRKIEASLMLHTAAAGGVCDKCRAGMSSVWRAIVPKCVNSTLPGQNGRHFADDTFKCIFLNGEVCILIRSSLKFVSNGLIDDKPALTYFVRRYQLVRWGLIMLASGLNQYDNMFNHLHLSWQWYSNIG